MANVAHNGVIFHHRHLPATGNVAATSGGDKDIALEGSILHRRQIKTCLDTRVLIMTNRAVRERLGIWFLPLAS